LRRKARHDLLLIAKTGGAMSQTMFDKEPDLTGKKVVLGFSGGPDAAALAYHLKRLGANVVPVYINYRAMSGGGKTAKDLRSTDPVAELLEIPVPMRIRAPLGNLPKSHRNRFFVKVLASIAKEQNENIVALGTIMEAPSTNESIERASISDLDPKILARQGNKYGVQVLTWDDFGVSRKMDEFAGLDIKARCALFQTTSCQMWWRPECGDCHSCRARHNAFLGAFGYDPTPYRQNSKIGKEYYKHE
jgi:7-cyano-7-deazaguanine synthase in queuosine biosynthesis